MARESGVSTIEFRRLDRAASKGGLTFQVVIDGRSLEQRYNSARGRWNTSAPLSTRPSDGISPLDLWGASFDPASHEGDLCGNGRVAVLSCGCGELMCGGVIARIEFSLDLVRWSDFAHANYLTPKEIGPFVFDRRQYERALAVARRDGGDSG